MSRLTKEQAMNLYGRNLPTPTIEKMTLMDVKSDDEFIVSLEELAAVDFEDGEYEAALDYMNDQKEYFISHTTRVDLDISFYLQTWEGFDVNELTRELFEQITTSPSDLGTSDTSNSLYINAAVTYPSSPDAGDSAGELRRKNKLDLLSMFYDYSDRDQFNQLDRISPDSRAPDANYLAAAMSNFRSEAGHAEYEVSAPLSEFYEVAQLTAEYDADDNPIIKVSNIKLTFYITAFSNHPNITFYAAVSTGHPAAIAAGTPIDPVSYSMNFSDLTYEALVKNGSLSSIGEPVFIDSSGAYYPNMPLRAINKKYYKIDDYGPKQIIDQTNVFLSEYRAYLASDEALLDAVNQIKLLIQTEQDSIQFLQILNKAGQIYSETSETTRFSRFYERFRILVNNADATLRNQQEVVKRVFRNYKVVDARSYVPPPMDAMSYVPELSEPSDYLYEQIFHSNVANFVPIEDGSDFPGRAELPFTPSERLEQFSEAAKVIRNEVVRLLMPYRGGTKVRGLDYDASDPVSDDVYDNARQQTAATRLPWEAKSGMSSETNKLYTDSGNHAYSIDDVSYSASEINEMLGDEYSQDHPIDRAALKLTWWIYHVWAGRFVQGSEHNAYKVNNDFDGVHWYVASSQSRSGDAKSKTVRSKRAEWPIRNKQGKNKRPWPPQRWTLLVTSLCQEMSYVPPTRDVGWQEGTKTGIEAALAVFGLDDTIGTDDTVLTQPPPAQRPAAATTDAWTVSKFGYSPSAAYGQETPHTIFVDGTPGDDVNTNYTEGVGKTGDHPAFYYYVELPFMERVQRLNEGRERDLYAQYYLNSFFYTVTDDKNVWALHTLGNLDEQLSFWVPKSSITPTGREIDKPESLDWDPSTGMTWPAETYWTGNVNAYWERIGGIRAISARRPQYADGTPYLDTDMYRAGAQPQNSESEIPYVRIKRRKLKRIYRDVRALVMNLFGMNEEDGKGMLQATTDASGQPQDSDVDSGTTNPFTTLDTYLQEMPGLIADQVSNKMFDALKALPYADLDSVAEIHAEAAAATERLHQDYLEALDVYLKKDLCSIYVATTALQVAGDFTAASDTGADNYRMMRPYASGDGHEYASSLHWGTAGSVIAGGAGETVVPYGHFSLPDECQIKGHFTGAPTMSQRQESEVFKLDFGEGIKQLMLDNFLDNKDRIKAQAREYLSTRRDLDALQTDVGIHSALAEVDIVLNKYGYFFFDLEKYIRKRSLMSQLINVDRLMAYMSRGQEMTNAAVRFQSVQVHLNNFGPRPESAPLAVIDAPWDHGNRGPMPFAANIKLLCDLDSSPYAPVNFKDMRFSTVHVTTRPLVYNRIERLNAVRFDQIAGYSDTTGADTRGVVVDSSGNVSTGELAQEARRSGPLPLPGPAIPGTGTSNEERYMAAEDYSPYKQAERDEAMLERSIGVLEDQEVDINAVKSEYGTANVFTKISLRNYVFEGFSDTALNMGASWQNNYRMMCFKYQFFMDDDLAYSNNAHEEYIDTLQSVDDIKISIIVRDNSPEIVKALCDKYIEEYEAFQVYIEDAKEACAFDAFDQKFNKFFVEAMLREYPTATQQPWFRMVATYITVYNLFSDKYAGNRSKMEEAANNMIETIRPETGYLAALVSFDDACARFKVQLEEIKIIADTVDNGMAEYFTGEKVDNSHGALVYFDIYRTLAAPVIDHIGDYTTREAKMLDGF